MAVTKKLQPQSDGTSRVAFISVTGQNCIVGIEGVGEGSNLNAVGANEKQTYTSAYASQHGGRPRKPAVPKQFLGPKLQVRLGPKLSPPIALPRLPVGARTRLTSNDDPQRNGRAVTNTTADVQVSAHEFAGDSVAAQKKSNHVPQAKEAVERYAERAWLAHSDGAHGTDTPTIAPTNPTAEPCQAASTGACQAGSAEAGSAGALQAGSPEAGSAKAGQAVSGEVQLASDERRSVDSGVVGIAKPSERQRASSARQSVSDNEIGDDQRPTRPAGRPSTAPDPPLRARTPKVDDWPVTSRRQTDGSQSARPHSPSAGPHSPSSCQQTKRWPPKPPAKRTANAGWSGRAARSTNVNPNNAWLIGLQLSADGMADVSQPPTPRRLKREAWSRAATNSTTHCYSGDSTPRDDTRGLPARPRPRATPRNHTGQHAAQRRGYAAPTSRTAAMENSRDMHDWLLTEEPRAHPQNVNFERQKDALVALLNQIESARLSRDSQDGSTADRERIDKATKVIRSLMLIANGYVQALMQSQFQDRLRWQQHDVQASWLASRAMPHHADGCRAAGSIPLCDAHSAAQCMSAQAGETIVEKEPALCELHSNMFRLCATERRDLFIAAMHEKIRHLVGLEKLRDIEVGCSTETGLCLQ